MADSDHPKAGRRLGQWPRWRAVIAVAVVAGVGVGSAACTGGPTAVSTTRSSIPTVTGTQVAPATPTTGTGTAPADSTPSPSTVVAAFISAGGPWCAPNDLRARFVAGEEGAGNMIATVYVGNVSARACALSGPVQMVGLTHSGQRDTPTATCGGPSPAQTPCPAPVVLPAHASFTDLTVDHPDTEYASVAVLGEYRDDIAGDGGMCAAHDEVTPYWLRLTLGRITLRVRNWSPNSNSPGLNSVFACHGLISV